VAARARRHDSTGVDLQERGLIFARRLLPVAITLFLAEAFLVGAFFDPLLALPFLALMCTALGAETVMGYRADIRHRLLVVEMEREQRAQQEQRRQRERELEARHERVVADLTTLASSAARSATVPALLSAQLGLLTPLVTDLLATTSPPRRDQLGDQLELATVAATFDLVSSGGEAEGRAVLYRRVGRRFEPVWPHGNWGAGPPSAGRRSLVAEHMRRVLKTRRPTASADSEPGEAWSGVGVPLRAGRRGYGVLWADRHGIEAPSNDEIEAIAVVAQILVAGVTGAGRRHGAASPASPSFRRPRPDPRVAGLVELGTRVRASVDARLQSCLKEGEAARVVRQELSARSARRGDALRWRRSVSAAQPEPSTGRPPAKTRSSIHRDRTPPEP
jgi:hypothetical protein